MTIELYPHQVEALAQLDKHEGFALFFDCGTGKTLTTIRDMERRFGDGRNKRALVIAPLSVIHSWVNEIQQHSHLSAVAYRGTARQRLAALESAAQVTVINYDMLHRALPDLLKAGFDYIVADESQRIISPNAKWTKAALKLADVAKTKRVLTGTPIRNWPLDLYNQMKFVNPSILPWRSHFAFRKQFAIETNYGGFTKIIGVRDEQDIRLRCAPFVRYVTFDDAIKGMPTWVDQVRTVEMLPEQKRLYKELAKDLLTTLSDNTITAQNAAIQTLRLSQIAGGTIIDTEGEAHVVGSRKLDELKEVAQQHKQIVVWVQFVAEAEWLHREMGWPIIHGGTSAIDRQAILRKFERGEIAGVIAQQQTLSEGVNELKNADCEVRWSYNWSYVTWTQSRARLRRAGRDTEKPCLSIQLVTEGTTDTKVIDAVRRKESVAVNTLEEIRRLIK